MVPESKALADALAKLVVAVIANHKALAGSVMVEIGADVTEAVKDLGPVLASAGLLESELKASPLDVAQALVDAGFGVAKALSAKAPVAPSA